MIEARYEPTIPPMPMHPPPFEAELFGMPAAMASMAIPPAAAGLRAVLMRQGMGILGERFDRARSACGPEGDVSSS